MNLESWSFPFSCDEAGRFAELRGGTYYGEPGRIVQSRAINQLEGYDIAYNQYNFTGQIIKTLKKHKIANVDEVTELYAYTYDPALRLLNTFYTLNNQTTIILASNTYDGLGRLTTKLRHNGADTEQFEYNIRNSPTKLKSGTFEENLYYNKNLPQEAQDFYNGNIAYSTWTYNGVTKGYIYVYDDLNRLNSAKFKQGTSIQGDDSYNENFMYDNMGNILTLQRKKDNVIIDDLTLHYKNGEKSNQIDWIYDSKTSLGLTSVKQYQNKSTATSAEFAYDANGNMTKDLDRNIGAIQYNILNLPDIIQFKNGNQIRNTYDASGRKLGTEYFTQLTNLSPLADGQIISQNYMPGIVNQDGTAYIGNFEYNTLNGNTAQTTLSRIYNVEGYVENIGSPNYYYYRKDHLRDNREVWLANTNTTVQRTQYYPSGLPWASNDGDNPGKQQRKYNGKEFVEMHGYDTYDIFWRQYYPAIMRFQTPDPEVENDYDLSPYTMCDNNMVLKTDPDGRVAVVDNIAGAFIGGLADYGVQVLANRITNPNESWTKSLTNVNVGSIIVSAGVGALTSGLSASQTMANAAVRVGLNKTIANVTAKAVSGAVQEGTGQALDNVIKGKPIMQDVVKSALTGAVTKQLEVKTNNHNAQTTIKRYDKGRALTHQQKTKLKSAEKELKANKVVEYTANTTTSTGSKIIDKKLDKK